METIIKKTLFNNLMQKLEIYPAETDAEKFNNWMRDKVQSIHYSNNYAMCEAYKRIIN